MRTEWVSPDIFSMLLAALMPENRLALLVSMATGLRISDVLSLRSERVASALRGNCRLTVKEQKTGKSRRVYIPARLLSTMVRQSGRYYVFEHRTDPLKHRNRTTVYKDLRRVAKMYRVDGSKLKGTISPHTARKIYAVEAMRKYGRIDKVQSLLNHSSEAVTMLYAMADQMSQNAR